ncbi:unnamed protein product [Clonostachys byssicola]|uniref:DUF7704 domain-containing protein n=1 Tax=Clonostachys byssicola TaxID=160290 RepID=A0A9N9U551_9HYPO|nr:unnamed protein product [Clonostachys byssicola]
MATKTTVPLYYDIYFRWIDPITSVLTTFMVFFNRDLILAQAGPVAPRDQQDPVLDPLMWQLAGLYLLIATLQGGLLRYTDDLGVWKISNFGVMVVDILIVCSLVELKARTPEGLSVAGMRPEDWLNWVLTILAVVNRLAFILDVGLKPSKVASAKKRV